jgi:hypothetical protein
VTHGSSPLFNCRDGSSDIMLQVGCLRSPMTMAGFAPGPRQSIAQ